MTQDESEQLSESTLGTESQSSESTSLDGKQSPPSDPDTKPIGRCYNELQEVKAAAQAMRTANARAQAALAKFWACRDAAAGASLGLMLQRDSTTATCQLIESHVKFIEKMIETP